MKVKIFLLCFFVLFLTSCAHSKSIDKNMQEDTEIANFTNESILEPSSTFEEKKSVQSSTPIDSDNEYASYSGEWISWNNPDNEAEGGVSLTITVEDNYLTGTFSAWSSNYGRLASSDISGDIQDSLCSTSFSDDGRGHSGTIVITFGQEQITADVSIQPQTQNSDFTFPTGLTILHLQKVEASSENSTTGEISASTLNVVDSDSDIELNFCKDSEEPRPIELTFGMNYDDVKNSLASIGEQITAAPWEEYSNFTLINKKELWPDLKTEEDFNKHVCLEKTLIEPNMQYTFSFIEENDSTILTGFFVGTSAIETNKEIKCGDSLNTLLDKYGEGYNIYETGKNIIYEYTTSTGYLRFIINPQTNLISEWGIDFYSYQDHSDENKELDRIFDN